MKFRLSENQKEVLKIVGLGVVLVSALFAPNIVQVLKLVSPQKKYKYKKTIEKLVRQDVIYLFGEEVRLTKKGEHLLRIIQTEDLEIEIPEKWNKVWHLVSYDIPETKKSERDFFRRKLIEFGFKQIQDSLWVLPYECKEEIAILSQSLGISPYVAYLNTDYLPVQNKLLKVFNL